MLLRCPHCGRVGEHVRCDFFGDWVVCPVCELPFAWRQAGADENGNKQNGNGRAPAKAQHTSTRSE
jgi:hypothetical protein